MVTNAEQINLNETYEQVREKSIKIVIHLCRNHGISKAKILPKLIDDFELDEDTAWNYIERFWID